MDLLPVSQDSEAPQAYLCAAFSAQNPLPIPLHVAGSFTPFLSQSECHFPGETFPHQST